VRQRRHLLTFTIISLLAIAAGLTALRAPAPRPEPQFAGKNLSQWLAATDVDGPDSEKVRLAIR
jgi:hypothetical protein